MILAHCRYIYISVYVQKCFFNCKMPSTSPGHNCLKKIKGKNVCYGLSKENWPTYYYQIFLLPNIKIGISLKNPASVGLHFLPLFWVVSWVCCPWPFLWPWLSPPWGWNLWWSPGWVLLHWARYKPYWQSLFPPSLLHLHLGERVRQVHIVSPLKGSVWNV